MSIRLSSNTVGSTALGALNSAVSPTPLVSASQSALSTLTSVGGINLRGSDILDSSTVNALVSQQSATNRTLDALSQATLGIVPGVAGATLSQISNPGSMMKPGLEEFVQSKMNMGLSFQQSVSNNLLTGVGANTVNGLINNTGAQVAAVTNSISSSVNGLINRGVITGGEPATQISGVVLGAANFGVEAVSSALSNIGSNITGAVSNIGSNISGAIGNITTVISDKFTGLSNMISSGNFASGAIDKLGGSIANSVSGALTGAISGAIGSVAGRLFGGGKSSVTVDQLQQQLLPASRQAYIQAEAALVGTMKPGEANYLSDNVPQRSISEAERLANALKRAELDLDFADGQLLAARAAYNENPNSSTQAALSAAEAALAKAKQTSAAVASDILSPKPKKRGGLFGGLKNPLSSITDRITNITDTVRSTVQQGVQIYTNITKAATLISTAYATGGLSLLANTKLAGSLGALSNPTKLAGDLVGKFNKSVGNLTDGAGKLSELATAGDAKLRNLLGSFGGTRGVKTASYASDTDKNSAAIASKTGQLLGNSIVPPPPTVTGETVTDLSPNEYIKTQAAAIQVLEDLESQRAIAILKIERLEQQLGNTTNAAILSQLQSARNSLATIDAQLRVAQIAYENTIRGA